MGSTASPTLSSSILPITSWPQRHKVNAPVPSDQRLGTPGSDQLGSLLARLHLLPKASKLRETVSGSGGAEVEASVP